MNAGYIDLDVSSTAGSYTFATWYKGSDAYSYFFDQGNPRQTLSAGGNTNNNDPPNAGMGVYDGSTWKNTGAVNGMWTTGEWVHLAWVLENDGLGAGIDSFSVYVDGVAQDADPGTAGFQAKRATASPIPNLSTAGNQRFFNRNDYNNALNERFDGLFDDVRIYDHALSSSEVAALIPEPATFGMLGAAAVAMLLRRRFRG
jgi:hypothetical protein